MKHIIVRYKYIICLIFLLIFVVVPVVGQNREKDRLLKDFENQIIMMNNLIFNKKSNKKAISAVNGLQTDKNKLSVFKTDSALQQVLDSKEKVENKLMNSRTGIQLSANTYYHFNNGNKNDKDDDDPLSQYKIKFQAELGWNFLQSSIFRRNIKKHIIHINRETDYINSRKISFANYIKDVTTKTNMKYDSLLSGVLQHHLANLQLLEKAEFVLLANEQVSSDKLLKIIEEKAEVERSLTLIKDNYQPSVELPKGEYGGITVDTADCIKILKENNSALKIYQLRRDLLNTEIKQTDYLNSISVIPYIRYSDYRGTSVSSSVWDVGVSFKLPLSTEMYRKRRSLDADIRLLDIDMQQIQQTIEDIARRIFGELDKSNNALKSEYRRLQLLRELLAARKKAYDNRRGEYDRQVRIREYNIYLLSLEKILSLCRQQELLIVELQSLFTDIDVNEFIKNNNRLQ